MNNIIENLIQNSNKDRFGNTVLCFEGRQVKYCLQEDGTPLLSAKDTAIASGISPDRYTRDGFKGDGIPISYKGSRGATRGKFVALRSVLHFLSRRNTEPSRKFLAFLVDVIGFKNELNKLPNLPSQGGLKYRMIPGYASHCAGEDGSIWRRQMNGWTQVGQRINKTGYFTVVLSDEGFGDKQVEMVHRAVLKAFSGIPTPEENFGCHKNGIRSDNRPKNLKWGTHRDNTEDALSHGNLSVGSKNFMAKIDERIVKDMRELYGRGHSIKTIARAFQYLGLSYSTISMICLGKTWKHIE